MKIGVLSDTHDHLTRIAQALDFFRKEQVEAVLHAGDICSPFAGKGLKRWNGPLTVIYGNNDGEQKGLADVLPGICEGPVLVELDGVRISMDHYAPGEMRVPIPDAEVIIFGHSHKPLAEYKEGVLLLNPGECCGWLEGKPTVAILETDPLKARIVPLET